MDWTNGSGKVLKTFADELMKKEREALIADDLFDDPFLIVIDAQTLAATYIRPSGASGGRTKGHGYKREPDVKQRMPHKIPPTLEKMVLYDMLIPMLAKQIGEEKELDYSDESNWSPLIKAACDRVATAMLETQELNIKNKEAAKHWKENHAKYKEEIETVVDKVRDQTWTTKAGGMFCDTERVEINIDDFVDVEEINQKVLDYKAKEA
jgi:ubiquitin-protein ligase